MNYVECRIWIICFMLIHYQRETITGGKTFLLNTIILTCIAKKNRPIGGVRTPQKHMRWRTLPIQLTARLVKNFYFLCNLHCVCIILCYLTTVWYQQVRFVLCSVIGVIKRVNSIPSHCVKSVRVWSCFGPYSIGMQENTDQKNSEYGHFSHSVDSFLWEAQLIILTNWIKVSMTKVSSFSGRWHS